MQNFCYSEHRPDIKLTKIVTSSPPGIIKNLNILIANVLEIVEAQITVIYCGIKLSL